MSEMHACECGKEYRTATWLIRHRAKCPDVAVDAPEVVDDNERGASEPEAVAPKYSEEEIQNIAKGIIRNSVPAPVEEILDKTVPVDGGRETEAGIFVDARSLAKLTRTKWHFVLQLKEKAASVWKVTERGDKVFVREYSKEVHGGNWKELADCFVKKNNNK